MMMSSGGDALWKVVVNALLPCLAAYRPIDSPVAAVRAAIVAEARAR